MIQFYVWKAIPFARGGLSKFWNRLCAGVFLLAACRESPSHKVSHGAMIGADRF